jgi:RNA-binding protein NOB1
MTSDKSVHTIILDAGPIIKGDPSVSSLLAQSEQIVTLPSVIQEIRDEATRSRLQTTLLPFLTLKSPREGSVKIITDFARKTGDLLVLSRVDINLLALAYDLECERNGGDWRLRKSPGEKRINGPKPDAKVPESAQQNNESAATTPATSTEQSQSYPSEQPKKMVWGRLVDYKEPETTATSQIESASVASASADESASGPIEESQDLSSQQELAASVNILQLSDASEDGESSDSDSEGWITPSNLKKKAEEDVTKNTDWTPEPRTLQVVSLWI